jgi:hypothetical protein
MNGDALTGVPGPAVGTGLRLLWTLAKSFGDRHGERVDANVALACLGAANVAGGVFAGFAAIGSSSRTAARFLAILFHATSWAPPAAGLSPC